MSKRVFFLLAGGLFLIHMGLAAVVPPASDELYYWCWSREPQLSYYDHPPLTAYLIWLSTAVFGDTLFAIRLPACLCMFGVLVVLGRLTRPRFLLGLVMLTPLCCLCAILITPDAPLLFFWAAYVLWLARLHVRLDNSSLFYGFNGANGSYETHWPHRPRVNGAFACGTAWRTWLLGGVLLGLGILSKYTMGLAGMAAALSLLTVRPWRKWLPGFVLHSAVAFAVSSPILLYNIQMEFAPLLFQWRHAMQADEPTIRHLPEFVGGQMLTAGLLPFLLVPWLIRHFRSLHAEPRLRACLWLFLVPFLFFVYKAVRGRVELNWPIACYLAFWPLAAHWFEKMRGRAVARRLGYSAFALPVAATLLAVCHCLWPLAVVPPKLDRLSGYAGWCQLSRDIGATVEKVDPQAPVFAPTYQLTSYLRFHHVHGEQLPEQSRPSHFTLRPVLPEQQSRFFVICEDGRHPPAWPQTGPPVVVGEFSLFVRGEVVRKLWLLHYKEARVRMTQPCTP